MIYLKLLFRLKKMHVKVTETIPHKLIRKTNKGRNIHRNKNTSVSLIKNKTNASGAVFTKAIAKDQQKESYID